MWWRVHLIVTMDDSSSSEAVWWSGLLSTRREWSQAACQGLRIAACFLPATPASASSLSLGW